MSRAWSNISQEGASREGSRGDGGSMTIDRALGFMGLGSKEGDDGPAHLQKAVEAPKVEKVETKKQKEARLAAEKEAKKRAKVAAMIAGKDAPKKEKKEKKAKEEETPAEDAAASASPSDAAAAPSEAAAAGSSSDAPTEPVAAPAPAKKTAEERMAEKRERKMRTYTEEERRRAIKAERMAAEAAERAFATAYELTPLDRLPVREEVEYHVRGADELEAARVAREYNERLAEVAAAEKKILAEATAACNKKGCQITLDEWKMLRMIEVADAMPDDKVRMQVGRESDRAWLAAGRF